MHVSKVILPNYIVLMIFDELVFVWQLKDDSKYSQELLDNLIAFATKGFNALDIVLQYCGLLAVMITVELWQIVNLNIVGNVST